MANAQEMERRGIKDGSVVYLLDADRINIEIWRVVKGVVVGDVAVPSPRVAIKEGFQGDGDTSNPNQSRRHANELFTPQEVIDALDADLYHASNEMHVPEDSENEIDGLLSLAIGNYLVAGALVSVLNERVDQDVTSRLDAYLSRIKIVS